MGLLGAHRKFRQAPRRLGAACGMLVACSLAPAPMYEFSINVLSVDSDGRDSHLDGQFGKLRYDEGDSGVHLGRVRLAITQPLGEVFSLYVDASSWGDDYKTPIDLTEAFL